MHNCPQTSQARNHDSGARARVHSELHPRRGAAFIVIFEISAARRDASNFQVSAF